MIETEKTRPVGSIEESCLESQASNSEPLFSVKSFLTSFSQSWLIRPQNGEDEHFCSGKSSSKAFAIEASELQDKEPEQQ
jgi:hypothetical protein